MLVYEAEARIILQSKTSLTFFQEGKSLQEFFVCLLLLAKQHIKGVLSVLIKIRRFLFVSTPFTLRHIFLQLV